MRIPPWNSAEKFPRPELKRQTDHRFIRSVRGEISALNHPHSHLVPLASVFVYV